MTGAAAPLVLLTRATGPGSGPGTIDLLSPAVGILRAIPASGRMLVAGEVIARLTILGRSHPLLVPEGISGRIAANLLDGYGADAIPVEYGQSILTLEPLGSIASAGAPSAGKGGAKRSPGRKGAPSGSAAGGAVPGAAAGSRAAGAGDLPAGCRAVLAPADGVLYRRPRPKDPPYVEIGSRVHAGQTLALIEAMKCFSAITYEASRPEEEAEIVEIRAEDASEVRHGAMLFIVKILSGATMGR